MLNFSKDTNAQDAIYHDNCLIELYRTANTKQRHYIDSERQLHRIALSEIISFIEDNTNERSPIFRYLNYLIDYNVYLGF